MGCHLENQFSRYPFRAKPYITAAVLERLDGAIHSCLTWEKTFLQQHQIIPASLQ